MNDRYLFKAKRIDNGEWVVGYLCRAFRWQGDKEPVPAIQEKDCFYFRQIDESTLCQCTGLKDKNGNLIWENDVVVCNIEECSGYVAWNESECGFYFIAVFDDGTRDVEPLCDYANELEVIGSIFDNPKLLEVE